MHITRQIAQQLAMELGEPAVEVWSIEMQDEEYAQLRKHIELRRTHDVTVLVLRGDELAVIRKPKYPPQAYRAPSGGIHPEESFLDGATRETWEETGLKVEIDGYLMRVHTSFTNRGETSQWTTHVMMAKTAPDASNRHDSDVDLAPVDTDEIESARWVSWDELINKVNPILVKSGLGGLAYRARIHERARELLLQSKSPAPDGSS